jgi:hypothetical protein
LKTAKPIAYKVESSSALNELALALCTIKYSPQHNPDYVTVHGCPKCRHETEFGRAIYVYRGFKFGPKLRVRKPHQLPATQAAAPWPPHVTVVCQCKAIHPGSDGAAGCGRFWNVPIERPTDD